MIHNYVCNLIDKLPYKFKNIYKNTNIHIVLEGGLFNGSYLSGCLFYLKELEKQKYIKIQKISGCSIGSIIALLYFIEDEEIISIIYNLAYSQFKKQYNINIFNQIFIILKKHLPNNIIKIINYKVYISYYNIKTCKHIVKCKYKNLDVLFETIRRSCSFPYVIDNQIYYKKKYIDGMYPFIFENSKNNRILYLNIHHLNKICSMISVKNENTNTQRVLEGIIEADIFFRHNSNTSICSFIDQWNIIDKIFYKIFLIIIYILIFILNKFYIINNLINESIDKNNININKFIYRFYIYLLNNYCI